MRMRALTLSAVSLTLAGAAAAEPNTYISAEGIEYYAPTANGWNFSPISNVLKIAELKPKYLDQLADAMPDIDLGRKPTRIYLVEKNSEYAPIGQISFSIAPVSAYDALTQREMRSEMAADPTLKAQLNEMLRPEMASTARGMEQTDLYISVRSIRNDIVEYGRWMCFTMLFDTHMSTGESPFYLSINCPSGRASLQFTVFFEPSHSDEVTSMAAKMVASVDVSRAKWKGVKDQ